MNVCLNTIPTETGATVRRPGTRHLSTTRGGARARLISFDFHENFPYLMEFTSGFLRFFTGNGLVLTNDKQVISAISTASPAVVTTAKVHGWSTGNAVAFDALAGSAQLQNRTAKITVLSTTTFSLADAVTDAAIDGAALDAFVAGNVGRILEIATPYPATSWSGLRSVQAEETAVLLNGTLPYVLTVTLEPTATQFASFALTPANFLDGPYLDPIPGSYVASSAQNGVVTLTFSFQPYAAAVAYNIGDYVSSGGVNYRSLTANNQGNAPAGSPTNWLVVNGGDPINAAAGFTSADIGRHLRLFSEPALWDSTATYAAKQSVAYTDGQGGYGYWTATGAIAAGIQPGTSTSWAPNATGAAWTWGRIVSVSAAGAISANSAFGTMTSGGGVAAAIDGNTSKSMASSAKISTTVATYPVWFPAAYPPGTIVQYGSIAYQRLAAGFDSATPPSLPTIWRAVGPMANLLQSGAVGGHFNVAQAISSVTIFPSADEGLTNSQLVTVNLRAKNSAPASDSDGTLLATTGSVGGGTTGSISLVSNDQVSTWNYVWVEMIESATHPLPDNTGAGTFRGDVGIAQIVFYTPNIANGSVVTAQIAGDAILYSSPIRKWRLGAYGGSNGYPFCGTYHEGRLWLSGVIRSRVDGGKPVDTNGNLFNFAPTSTNGVVADDNAITAVFEGPDVNAIRWMTPDQQGIICGTQAGEWLISPAAPGAITPTNIAARRVTKIGCADIEPRRTDHTLVFVQKFRRKIMEYFADVYSGKFSAPNLSEKSAHLTAPNIAEIAYQQEKQPVIWQRLDNGSLLGSTYRRDTLTTSQGPSFVAAHRHALGSARAVDSICVGPSSGGDLDSLAMVTSDAATSIHHVEIMTDMLDEGFALSSLWQLDDAIAPTTTAVVAAYAGAPYGGLKITGLWPHNGKTVSVFVAGLDCGDFAVSDGSVTVPYGDGVSGGTASGLFTQAFVDALSQVTIVVGFSFTSDGQIVRPAQQAESGTQAGPGFAKERRIDRFGAQLYGAVNGTILFGTDFTTRTLEPVKIRTKGDTAYTVLQQFSGIYRSPIKADSDFDNMLCWRQTRPNAAAFVIALGGRVMTQD